MTAYKLTEVAIDKKGYSQDYVIGYYSELEKAKTEMAELLYGYNMQGYIVDEWHATNPGAAIEKVEYHITRICIR